MAKFLSYFKSSSNSSSPNLFSTLDEKRAPNVKQYLRGLRTYSLLSPSLTRPYNYYTLWASLFLAYALTKYLKHSFTLTEFDQRKNRYPKWVYRIRREHYVYWELSRLARGLPKTFTYSNWDGNARMMYHVDREGRQLFEKINFREERVDLIENPLLGPLLRRREELAEDEVMSKRANKLAIYYLNMNKRYDLDNYLQYKPLTGMDWVRGVYHLFMVATGLADTYRNEQYIWRPDCIYNFERNMVMINFANPDKGQVADKLVVHLNYNLKQCIKWLDNHFA